LHWRRLDAGAARELRQPALKSQAALVVDQLSGEVLSARTWNRSCRSPRHQLMTAIVTLGRRAESR